MSLTQQDIMESSNETLGVWMATLKSEAERRHLGAEAIALHPGSVVNGQPIPLVVRVLTKIAKLKPADLAKVESLVDGFARAEAP